MMMMVLLLMMSAMISDVEATQYVVGDATNKWRLNVDYSSWAARYSFKTGDTLLFNYDGESHSVYQVSKVDYSSCNNLKPIKVYNDGDTHIDLEEETTYYFICGVSEHCVLGMKVAINVGQGSTSTPMTNVPPPLDNVPITSPSRKSPGMSDGSSSSSPPMPAPLPIQAPSKASPPTKSRTITSPIVSPIPSSSSPPLNVAPSAPSSPAPLSIATPSPSAINFNPAPSPLISSSPFTSSQSQPPILLANNPLSSASTSTKSICLVSVLLRVIIIMMFI